MAKRILFCLALLSIGLSTGCYRYHQSGRWYFRNAPGCACDPCAVGYMPAAVSHPRLMPHRAMYPDVDQPVDVQADVRLLAPDTNP